MKKYLISALSVLVFLVMALCITPGATLATTISANDWVTLIRYNDLDMAGIMTYAVADSKGGNVEGIYDTFCIQDNVYIWTGESFLVKDISSAVGKFENPLIAGVGTLNGGVDYLFYLFESGKYDYELFTASNKKQNQADLQKTLWNLQGSGPSYTGILGTPWAIDLNNYLTDSKLQHSWGTQVLNIVDSRGNGVQNQLYNQVPEPATMLLLGFGLLGLAGMKQKFKN